MYMRGSSDEQTPTPRNLVVHQGALGDWVLVFPLLRALEGATLAVTAWEKARLAARLIPSVTAIDIESRDFTAFHVPGGWREVSTLSRERLGAVDGWVVSFVSDGRDAWAENAARLMPRARFAFVQPRPPADWREHVTRWHAAQLAEQGLVLREVAVEPRANPHGPVVIHPGSGGANKCWPRERYEQIVAWLRARGVAVLPILGEVEMESWPAAACERWCGEWYARRVQTLDSLADLLETARIFIGNDSGPTHLAAQMGVTTFALFGPSLPSIWSPAGPRVNTIAPREPCSMTWLGDEPIRDALGRLLQEEAPHYSR